MGTQWHVLRTKPHKESTVSELLQQQGVDHFYPALSVKPANPRARRRRPYFPGYLFVHIDLDVLGSDALRWEENTYGLVRFGDVPAVVPEQFIVELRRRLREVRTVTELQLDGLQPGDEVTIIDGPLAGYRAIFDARLPARDRVQVLLSFLSAGPQRLQQDAENIRRRGKRRRR